MKKDDVLQYFGTQQAIADALGISQESVSKWDSVPHLRQLQLESLTKGLLKADASILPKPVKAQKRVAA
jgi:DNA-binding transcriptional regulator YdaS (Cro superfamily)